VEIIREELVQVVRKEGVEKGMLISEAESNGKIHKIVMRRVR
jgi:hypothetical protein